MYTEKVTIVLGTYWQLNETWIKCNKYQKYWEEGDLQEGGGEWVVS